MKRLFQCYFLFPGRRQWVDKKPSQTMAPDLWYGICSPGWKSGSEKYRGTVAAQ